VLVHVGMPSPGDNYMEYIRVDHLRMYGLKSEDIIITFDHAGPKGEFQVNYGRKIRRQEDGFYHVTAHEWDSFCGMPQVTLIGDDSA